jgi:isopenicillin N synthase-like dioxygenase
MSTNASSTASTGDVPVCPPISARLLDTDPAQFSALIGQSFARFGFAVVADHGIATEIIDAVKADMRAFFALPEATKLAYRIKDGGGQRGYTPFGVEAAKGAKVSDLKEFWHVGRDLPHEHRLYPDAPKNIDAKEIPNFHARGLRLYQALDHLGVKILSAIARYLGLAPNYFDDKVRDGNSILRLLHYPPINSATDAVRAEAHEDINVITLLLGAEEAGLQLLDRDGRWRDISPPPDCVVINIGDMLQRLTNHVLPSTTHRVINPPPERAHLPRYSMPFFLHFESDFPIATLPGCITADNPNRYPAPILADDFLKERLKEIKLT